MEKLSPIVTEFFTKGRNVNISLFFISQSYFRVPKYLRLSVTHYFIITKSKKRELQDTAFHYSSDIEFKDFMKLYEEPLSVLVNDTTLSLGNP